MKKKTLLAAELAALGLLTACGGGSGSDSTSTPTDTTPSVTASAVTLSGTAAKGLMANADVAVYAVNADGSLAAAPLASATTDNQGHYSLKFDGSKGQPYVVKVSAKANGSTTHLDEVTGQSQALPADFSMRAVVVPASSGQVSTSASITPFSEMAVAAAAKATGGLTAQNVDQAVSTVKQLLGFDPAKVEVSTTPQADGSDAQKLALMLTAVSQLANAGDMGCASGSAGDKVKCVVDTLAASAKSDTIKLSTGSGEGAKDVSAALAAAVTTVVTSPTLSAGVSQTALTAVLANLDCGTQCAAAPVGSAPEATAPSATATAIAAAKLLFNELRTDWATLFSRGGDSGLAVGAANKEAASFVAAMQDAQVPVDVLAKDTAAMLLGIRLYNDVMSGRSTVLSKGAGPGELVSLGGLANANSVTTVGCTLYSDAQARVEAKNAAEVKTIGCSARTRVEISDSANGRLNRQWGHGFTLTPAADGGSFGWTSRARIRNQLCTSAGCTVQPNTLLQSKADDSSYGVFSGTVTPTLSGPYGSIVAVALKGDLPPALVNGGREVLGFKHTLDIAGTLSQAADGSGSAKLAGSIVAKAEDGSTLSTLTLTAAELNSVEVSRNAAGQIVSPSSAQAVAPAGGELSGVKLALVYSHGTAAFEGSLELGATTWDASGTEAEPTLLKASGTLRNTPNAATTVNFITGTLQASTTGWATFDASKAPSSSNRYTQEASFSGSITAPGRPVLALSLGSGWVHDAATPRALPTTLQYRSLVNGTPRIVLNAGTVLGSDGQVSGFKLSEASGNLNMAWAPGASKVDLLQGEANKIGELSTSSGLLTFTDGSSLSLDIGL